MLIVLTLMLVALPGLTSSFPQTSYVCCNQPPTRPPTLARNRPLTRLGSLALSTAKRGERNSSLRRVLEEVLRLEQQRQKTRQLQEDAQVFSADSPSSVGDPDSLYSRRQDAVLAALFGGRSGSKSQAPFSSIPQEADNSQDLMLVDYPGKRAEFVGADGSKSLSKTDKHAEIERWKEPKD